MRGVPKGALRVNSVYQARVSAFTRYCFTSKLYCGSQSSFYCPSPPARPTLLHYYCTTTAQYTSPHRPLLSMPYTIQLVVAISCECQPGLGLTLTPTLSIRLPYGDGLVTCRAYVLNRYSRIPVAQPQEYEYRIPPGEPCICHGYAHIQGECIHTTG